MWVPATPLSRRQLLAGSAAGLLAGRPSHSARGGQDPAGAAGRALIAITLDLEMSRNFPTWDQTHWDYEKGTPTAEPKRCGVEAARRVKRQGGRVHFFAVGQVFEQERV